MSAATQSAALDTIINTLITNINTALASPKPSYKVNDQEFNWTEYVDMQFRSLEKANELRSKLAGPVSLISVMRAF